MSRVRAVPVNAGQKGEYYILIHNNDGDVLHAPNHWKTQRGAERWAEKNGFSVAKPAAKPSAKPGTPKKKDARLPKSVGFIEKNANSAYVIHGDIGTRRYIGYTKREALARYNAEVKGKKK